MADTAAPHLLDIPPPLFAKAQRGSLFRAACPQLPTKMRPSKPPTRSAIAKAFGVHQDPNDRSRKGDMGENVAPVGVEPFAECEPTVDVWLRNQVPTKQDMIDYPKSLFPFIYWLPNYNLQWLIGDLVAGITVGAVVVPQSMAYAQLAELPVQYGLYSSFMGVLIYFFFATSKDITIGVSVAVQRLQTVADENSLSL